MKQVEGPDFTAADPRIPPLPSGGPIEARLLWLATSRLIWIPPLPSGGPIEAHPEDLDAKFLEVIPPLPSGGPIEAQVKYFFIVFPSWIPPLPSGGPIEANANVILSGTPGEGFHRYQAVAPIEAYRE